MSLAQRQTEYNRLIQETRRMFDDLGLGAITSYKHVLKSAEIKVGAKKPSYKDIERLQKLHKRSEMLKEAKVSLVYTRTRTAEDLELRASIRSMLNEEIKKEKQKEKNKQSKDKDLRQAYRTIYSFLHAIEAVLYEIDSRERQYNWLSGKEQGARRGGFSLSQSINQVIDFGSRADIIGLGNNIDEYCRSHNTLDINALYKEDQTGDISQELFSRYSAILENSEII